MRNETIVTRQYAGRVIGRCLGALFVSAACLSSACASAGGGDEANRPRGIIIEVTNKDASDVTVYVARPGSRARLGSISANTRGRLLMKPALAAAGRVQLIVRRFGTSEEYVVPELRVFGDEKLELTIEVQLPLSNVVVR